MILPLDLHINFPGRGDLARQDEIIDPRDLGFPQQLEIRFVGGTVGFALIARPTSTDRIPPRVFAPPAGGNDVVDGKVCFAQRLAALFPTGADATVGTGVSVTLEHTLAAPTRLALRHVDIVA